MLEEEEGLKDLLKYVIYPDKGGSWRVQAVPIGSGSFTNRWTCVCMYCVVSVHASSSALLVHMCGTCPNVNNMAPV